jgi:hypothetical protein
MIAPTPAVVPQTWGEWGSEKFLSSWRFLKRNPWTSVIVPSVIIGGLVYYKCFYEPKHKSQSSTSENTPQNSHSGSANGSQNEDEASGDEEEFLALAEEQQNEK